VQHQASSFFSILRGVIFFWAPHKHFTEDAPLEAWGRCRYGWRHPPISSVRADWLTHCNTKANMNISGDHTTLCETSKLDSSRSGVFIDTRLRKQPKALSKQSKPIKDETFKFLLEDWVGTPHTSERAA
jgi:hypothetical protein